MNLASMNRYKYMINQNTGQCSQSEEICRCEGQKKGLWMTFGPVVKKWKGGSLLCFCMQRLEGSTDFLRGMMSSFKCRIETIILYISNFPYIIIHNACFKGLYTCRPSSWKTIPKADGCKATVSLNNSPLCHLTLKSTKTLLLSFCAIQTSLQLSMSLLAFTKPSEPM